ncbi:hypothetical protein HOD08_02290 [bacterium]|nr:hypothetical protein [bacterium]
MRKIIFISVALFTSLGINSLTFDDVKKMINSLSDEYLSFSPLNGTLLVDTPYLNNILKNTNPKSSTSKIVKEFFSRDPAGELNLSSNTHFVSALSPKGLGVLAAITDGYKSPNELQEKIKSTFSLTNNDLFDKEFVEEKNKAWEKKNEDRKKMGLKTAPWWLDDHLRDFNILVKQHVNNKGQAGAKFVKSLVIARAWKHSKISEKVDDFFDGIKAGISPDPKKPVSLSEDKPNEEMRRLNESSYEQLRKEFATAPEGFFSKDPNQTIAKNRALLALFAGIKTVAAPEKLLYSKGEFRGEKYSNCAETAFMSLFNFVRAHTLGGQSKFSNNDENEKNLFRLFNVEPEEFYKYQEEKLLTPPADETKEEATKLAKFRAVAFFKKYPTTDSQKKAEAHDAWMNVVSNLNGVIYNNTNDDAEIPGESANKTHEPVSLSAVIKNLTGNETIKDFMDNIGGIEYQRLTAEDDPSIISNQQMLIFKTKEMTYKIEIGELHYLNEIGKNWSVDTNKILKSSNPGNEALPFFLAEFTRPKIESSSKLENKNVEHQVSKVTKFAMQTEFQSNRDQFFKKYLFASSPPAFAVSNAVETFLGTNDNKQKVIGKTTDDPESFAQMVTFVDKERLQSLYGLPDSPYDFKIAQQIAHTVPIDDRMQFLVKHTDGIDSKEKAVEIVKTSFSARELPSVLNNAVEEISNSNLHFYVKLFPEIVKSISERDQSIIKETMSMVTARASKENPKLHREMLKIQKRFETMPVDQSTQTREPTKKDVSAEMLDAVKKLREKTASSETKTAAEKSKLADAWGKLKGFMSKLFGPKKIKPVGFATVGTQQPTQKIAPRQPAQKPPVAPRQVWGADTEYRPTPQERTTATTPRPKPASPDRTRR